MAHMVVAYKVGAHVVMTPYSWPYNKAHKCLWFTANIVHVSCRLNSLQHAPKHWFWPLRICWSLGNSKHCVNLASSGCARCVVLYIIIVVYIYACNQWDMQVCMSRCVNPCTIVQGWQLFRFLWSPITHKTTYEHLLGIKLGYSVFVMCTSLTHFERTCLWTPTRSKRYPHLVSCIIGLKRSLKNLVSWILVHDFKVEDPISSALSCGPYSYGPYSYGLHSPAMA